MDTSINWKCTADTANAAGPVLLAMKIETNREQAYLIARFNGPRERKIKEIRTIVNCIYESY